MTQPAPPAGIAAQLASARAVLDHPLGGALQALYLFGSAVDGGLKPHSDIDLLAIVDAPLAEPARRGLMTGPWRYRHGPARRHPAARSKSRCWRWAKSCRGAIRPGANCSSANGCATTCAPAWALERLPRQHRPVLAHARDTYLGGLPDGLADRPEPMAAFVGHVKAAIGKAFTQDP